MAEVQIKSVRAWHEELLEFVLANPRASLAEASLYFNVSVSWISVVRNSDAFQELWAQRRGEHFSRVSASLSERVQALADVTIDKLSQKVEKDDVSIAQLKEVGDMALKSLGFGVSKTQVNVHNNTGPQQTNVFINKETLSAARAAKAKLQELNPLSLPAPKEENEQNQTTMESGFEREF